MLLESRMYIFFARFLTRFVGILGRDPCHLALSSPFSSRTALHTQIFCTVHWPIISQRPLRSGRI